MKLYVDKTFIRFFGDAHFVSGAVNSYSVEFEFSDAWEGLSRTATFTNGTVIRSVLLDETNKCNVPWEVLVTPRKRLSIGVVGKQGDEIVMPTVWADMGAIQPGASVGEEGHEPTPSIIDQLIGRVTDLEYVTYSIDNYVDIRRVKPYLYEIFYNNINYDLAYKHFENGGDFNVGHCTSIRRKNWFGRQFDWIYSDSAEFVVHTPRIGNRFASVGVSANIGGLTDEFVRSGEHSNLYRMVPFYLLDGINEYGVVASGNVVPTDKGENISEPTGTKEVTINSLMLIRYILDNFSTARDAVTFIREHMCVYFPEALHKIHYEEHFMVADATDTFLVEFIDNRAVVTDMGESSNSLLANKSYMTNFYLTDVIPNDDGTVYTPETMDAEHNAKITNHITDLGAGLERYNLIVPRFNSIESGSDMRNLLNDLMYTRAYPTSERPAVPVWYTEFVGARDLKVDSPASEFAPIMPIVGEMFLHRSRTDTTNTTWQTMHSALYDIENRKMRLVVQEDGEEMEFSVTWVVNEVEIEET